MSDKHRSFELYPGDPNAFESHVFFSINESGTLSADVVAQTVLKRISEEQKNEIVEMSEKALAQRLQNAISARIQKFSASEYNTTFESLAKALKQQIDAIQPINE